MVTLLAKMAPAQVDRILEQGWLPGVDLIEVLPTLRVTSLLHPTQGYLNPGERLMALRLDIDPETLLDLVLNSPTSLPAA
jgi:hypothetical protein